MSRIVNTIQVVRSLADLQIAISKIMLALTDREHSQAEFTLEDSSVWWGTDIGFGHEPPLPDPGIAGGDCAYRLIAEPGPYDPAGLHGKIYGMARFLNDICRELQHRLGLPEVEIEEHD